MSKFWAELEEEKCPCQGSGWALRDSNYQECPVHFEGQLHPETKELLLDDSNQLQEETKRAYLKWKITMARTKVKELQDKLKEAQSSLLTAELELVNRTPTIKMAAVQISDDPILEVNGVSILDAPPIESRSKANKQKVRAT